MESNRLNLAFSSYTNMKNIIKLSTFFCLLSIASSSIAQFENWYSIQSGTNTDLWGVSAPTQDVVYICGSDGLIKKSINGGVNWSTLNSGVNLALFNIYFFDADKGLVIGNNGTMLRTINGGQSWISVTPSGLPANFHFRGIAFVDSNIGYASGGVSGLSGKIYKTTNGGVSWTALSLSSPDVIGSLRFLSSQIGFASNYDGDVYKTINGGNSWTLVPTGLGVLMFELDFSDNDNGLVIGSGGTIIKTTNGGNLWSTIDGGVTDYLSSVKFYDGNNAFVVGGDVDENSATILATDDGGLTWEFYYPLENRLTRMTFYSSSLGYAVGITGALMKYDNPSSVGELENEVYCLVYPNPARHHLNLQLNPDYCNYNIQVMDISGRSVLSNQFNNTGFHTIDTSALSEGVYLLRLTEVKSGKTLVRRFVKE